MGFMKLNIAYANSIPELDMNLYKNNLSRQKTFQMSLCNNIVAYIKLIFLLPLLSNIHLIVYKRCCKKSPIC